MLLHLTIPITPNLADGCGTAMSIAGDPWGMLAPGPQGPGQKIAKTTPCTVGWGLYLLAYLGPHQRLGRQHRLHHEAAGAGIHHADRAERQQRHGLHGVAQLTG